MKANRILWRLWLIASVVWVVYLVWDNDVACPLQIIGFDAPSGPWCDYQNVDPIRHYGMLAIRLLSLPVLVAGFIAATTWIAAGFRPKNSN